MKKKISFILLGIMLAVLVTAGYFFFTKETKCSTSKEEKIDALVERVMKKAKVPGVSIAIIDNEDTKYLNYGYQNKEEKQETSEETFYELGSMSKAYTALGIYLLEDEKKLSLDDSIHTYLPWFHVSYDGYYQNKKVNQDVDITISQLLHHTSGIPFETIGDFPEGSSEHALYETVYNISGIALDYYPGDKFQYATINYDILGLIIEKITGQSYEQFIQKNILTPLGLKNTFLFKEDVERAGTLATGYKVTRFQPRAYNPPVYRGNTPAGYIYSNAVDMQRWIRIQMGLIPVEKQFQKIIEKSHITDTSVNSVDDYQYAGGWSVSIKGNDIRHGGSNPTYSSMIIMKPEDGFGICILTNLDSNAADYLADNIIHIMERKKVDKYETDSYLMLDREFTLISVASVLLAAVYLVLLIITLRQIGNGSRQRLKMQEAKIAGCLIIVPLILFGGFCIYYLPNLLFQRLSWKAVGVWGSGMIQFGCISGFAAYSLIMLYILLAFNFIKKDEKNYITLVVLSLLNGVTSAMIIFTINESFNRNLEYSKELLVYFLFSLIFYIYTYKLLQGRIIVIANELTYEKRIHMIKRILSSSYQSIETIGSDRIYSGLNNDCTVIAQIPELMVGFASNLLTLFFCLFYLLTKNLYAFLASLSIILLNGILAVINGRIASKYWEQNRDIQDTFFDQMSDLVAGFKELVLNRLRRIDFWNEIKIYSNKFSQFNQAASVKFLDFKLYNMLMYNVIFGVVVFIFPIFVSDLRNDMNQLRENLFIVFYMVGPFGAITSLLPQLTKARVNVKRIDKLLSELSEASEEFNLEETAFIAKEPVRNIHLALKDVMFEYPCETQGDKESGFTIGPVSFECSTGEVVYITGGNGSGKSTLGKLITGLYQPISGEILMNENPIETKELNELFASVFSDFNLFKRLYGFDYAARKDEFSQYLSIMGLQEKVKINDEGEFVDLKLSTGQRKRLAFIVSCLEDKPMLIFDEWAAEQDPHFRQYFYEELLPMLKSQGKGIIVISHDDRYFDRADKLIKLERGKLSFKSSDFKQE